MSAPEPPTGAARLAAVHELTDEAALERLMLDVDVGLGDPTADPTAPTAIRDAIVAKLEGEGGAVLAMLGVALAGSGHDAGTGFTVAHDARRLTVTVAPDLSIRVGGTMVTHAPSSSDPDMARAVQAAIVRWATQSPDYPLRSER